MAIGLAGSGLAFLWMQRQAPPSVAARAAGEPVKGSPAATPPDGNATAVHFEPLTLLFDFDRAALRPAETASLDRLADALKAKRVGRVRAAGHADRIGSDAYNLALSGLRAEAVRSYLLSRGIDPDALDIVANGERIPASGDTCPAGTIRNADANLIECLQPDRRVVITMPGKP